MARTVSQAPVSAKCQQVLERLRLGPVTSWEIINQMLMKHPGVMSLVDEYVRSQGGRIVVELMDRRSDYFRYTLQEAKHVG